MLKIKKGGGRGTEKEAWEKRGKARQCASRGNRGIGWRSRTSGLKKGGRPMIGINNNGNEEQIGCPSTWFEKGSPKKNPRKAKRGLDVKQA